MGVSSILIVLYVVHRRAIYTHTHIFMWSLPLMSLKWDMFSVSQRKTLLGIYTVEQYKNWILFPFHFQVRNIQSTKFWSAIWTEWRRKNWNNKLATLISVVKFLKGPERYEFWGISEFSNFFLQCAQQHKTWNNLDETDPLKKSLYWMSFWWPDFLFPVCCTVEHGITGESSLKNWKKFSQDQATFKNLITQKWFLISISFFLHMKI